VGSEMCIRDRARAERLLKVPVTARNWRTIDAIAGMIESGA